MSHPEELKSHDIIPYCPGVNFRQDVQHDTTVDPSGGGRRHTRSVWSMDLFIDREMEFEEPTLEDHQREMLQNPDNPRLSWIPDQYFFDHAVNPILGDVSKLKRLRAGMEKLRVTTFYLNLPSDRQGIVDAFVSKLETYITQQETGTTSTSNM